MTSTREKTSSHLCFEALDMKSSTANANTEYRKENKEEQVPQCVLYNKEHPRLQGKHLETKLE